MSFGAWFARLVGKLDPRKFTIKKVDDSAGSGAKMSIAETDSVESLLIAYQTAYEAGETEKEKQIIERLLPLVTTFQDWARIYEISQLKKEDKSHWEYHFGDDDDDYFHEDIKIFESYLRVVAFVEMLKRASTFYEWWQMIRIAKCRPRGKSMRLERYLGFVLSNRDGEFLGKITEIIDNGFNIWTWFIEWAIMQMSEAKDEGIVFEQLDAIKNELRIIETYKHARECEPTRVSSEACKQVRSLIGSKMVEIASSVQQLTEVAALYWDHDLTISVTALNKAMNLAATLEEWLRIYRSVFWRNDMVEIIDTAWDKITMLAVNFDDWENVSRSVRSSRLAFVLQKMLELAKSFEKLTVIYRLIREDTDDQDLKTVREEALARMSKITGSSAQFLVQTFARA